MTALDLSPWAGTVDTPEVEAYKQKVKEVAQRYARDHNWCSVVNRALAELGIDDTKTVDVGVTLSSGITFNTRVAAAALLNRSEAEQFAVVAEKVPTLSIGGINVASSTSLPVTVESISGLTLLSSPPPEPGSEIEEDGVWLYTSNEGRVRHFFRDAQIVNEQVVEGPRRHERYYGYRYRSVCGTETWSDPVIASPRGTGNDCAKCIQRRQAEGR